MKRAGYILAGLIAGVVLSIALPAAASWLVQSSGDAQVRLGSLEPVKVGTATLSTDTKALPGKKVELVVDLDNPNGVTVQVIDSDLRSMESQDADCKASLGEGIKYAPRDDFDLADGKTEDVVLGIVSLGKLANSCQGAELEGTAVVKVGYGS